MNGLPLAPAARYFYPGLVKRFLSIIKVRPDEGWMTVRLTGLMFTASAGGAIGSPGIEALFYSRFGVQYLPYMYFALGLVTVLMSLAITALLSRVDRRQLYGRLPLAMALILLAERALLIFNLNWLYPVFWLGMNVFWACQSLFTWGLAGMSCDVRQAKRLFPLFGAGGILGLALGGLATKPLVEWIGTENLLLVWAGGLALTFALSRSLLSRTGKQPKARSRRGGLSIGGILGGFHVARRSPLMRWMSLAAVLFAVVWFSLVFPFSRAAAAQFRDEKSLAGFLGSFQGLSTGTAILVSLLAANRLYARLGFMAAILIYPALCLAGFAVLAVHPAFSFLVAFRFVQNVWTEGVSEGANQAMYNVIPQDQREQTRAFVRGIANQLGVSLAGLLLILNERFLQPMHLYWIGIAAAAGTLFMVWQARKAYGQSIVEALRAGQPHLFIPDVQPFGGFKQDAEAMAAVIEGIRSEDPIVRRVSAEILSQVPAPEAAGAIISGLKDPDASVRSSLLAAIGRLRASSARLEVAACLEDAEPEVRVRAIEVLELLMEDPKELALALQPALSDPHPAVRGRAAAALLKRGPHPGAEAALQNLVQSDPTSRLEGLKGLAVWGSQGAYQLAARGLEDPLPFVRREAVDILARIDPQRCLFPLLKTLGDEDLTVREAAARAIRRVGPQALKPLISALEDARLEEGALLALEHFPLQEESGALRAYARSRMSAALTYHRLWAEGLGIMGNDGRLSLAVDSVREKSLHMAALALKGIGLLRDRSAVPMALETLRSKDPAQRANGLEILETIGEPEVVRPLLRLWEPPETLPPPRMESWLVRLMEDADPWLRACAVLASNGRQDSHVIGVLQGLAERDPNLLVRESARSALDRGAGMKTLPTLSMMERILFLKHVPLFAELTPADLKVIAQVTGEHFFTSGERIAEQGEYGDELYIIVAGKVGILFRDKEGKEKEIARRKPGEVVGEMGIISQEPRMASLVAFEEVRVLCIERGLFVEILRSRPEISLGVMRVLSQRIRESASAVRKE